MLFGSNFMFGVFSLGIPGMGCGVEGGEGGLGPEGSSQHSLVSTKS